MGRYISDYAGGFPFPSDHMFKKRPLIIILIIVLWSGDLHTQSLVGINNNKALSDVDWTLFCNELNSSLLNKDKFVYWTTTGQALSLAHRYEESNQCFERAYLCRLDQWPVQPVNEESYEDLHEVFMLLYFKAINYLELGKPEDAMVECRRMDEWLHPNNRKDTGRKLMQEDPLIHAVMGLIYEMNDDFNDSLISYNNAELLFEADYRNLFSKHVPEQIKKSRAEMDSLSEACESDVRCHPNHPYGELIFIWHNGQCPRKLLIGPDFRILSKNGNLFGSNPDIGVSTDCLGNKLLQFYQFSLPTYSFGELRTSGTNMRCELLEDASWFSIRALQERLRNDGIHVWHHGVNWSTLPSSIYYAVVHLKQGTNKFEFIIHESGGSTRTESFTVNGDGKAHLHMITTLENTPALMTGPQIRLSTRFFQ